MSKLPVDTEQVDKFLKCEQLQGAERESCYQAILDEEEKRSNRRAMAKAGIWGSIIFVILALLTWLVYWITHRKK